MIIIQFDFFKAFTSISGNLLVIICHAHNYENLKVKAILSIVERNREFTFKLLSLNVLPEVPYLFYLSAPLHI